MNLREDQKRYLVVALVIGLSLVLGWFGITFPVTPELPEPLPTATPADLSDFVTYDDLETMDAGAFAFSASSDATYNTACYMQQGGDVWVADSGCTWGVLSGGTFEVQSGATADMEGTFDFTGATVSGMTLSGATIGGNQTITGNLVVSGTTTAVGAVTTVGAVTVGSDGSGADVTLYSATAGDSFLWDASEEALTITGTDSQDALNVDDGNVDIADDVDVDGTTNLDVTDIDDTLNVGGMATFVAGVTGAEDVENIMLPTVVSTAFTYTAAAGGTVPLATITDGEIWLVHGVWLNVTTDFDCTGDDCTAVLGDGNDTDGFCVLSDTELQAADTEGTGWAAGWQCQVAATRGVYQDATGGFWYAPSGADETIDVVLAASGDDFSAGAATAYIVYTRIQ